MVTPNISWVDADSPRGRVAAPTALAMEKQAAIRSRLLVVTRLLERKRPVREVLYRAAISRSTAYEYLRLYRAGGVEALARHPTRGRPAQPMPPAVRERFQHLQGLGGRTGQNCIIYVPERESAVLSAIGCCVPCRKLSRWLRQFAREVTEVRVRRFRKIERALPHLDGFTRLLYEGDGTRRFRGAALRGRLPVEVYHYASGVSPDDRRFLSRFVAAFHAIRIRDVTIG